MHQTSIKIRSLKQAPQGCLLNEQLNSIGFEHDDFFYCDIKLSAGFAAQEVLALLLDAFINQPPIGVVRLMRFRNVLVKPLGLRTATLGCPVSSLVGKEAFMLFNNRFPVLAQRHMVDYAQVVLGADDKHLKFRSCISARQLQGEIWQLSLGTRVHYNNWFGRFYMGAIDAVHRRYVAPTMIRTAAEAMLRNVSEARSIA